jgi:hypothetical protein
MSDHWGTPPQQPEPGPQGRPEILTNRDASGSPSAAPGYGAPSPDSPSVTPTYLGGAGDILGAPQPAARFGGRGKLLAAGLGVVAVAAIGVGAAVAAGAIGHDSTQPETLVPASAVGYVSIDLDPSLGQKVDALRFMRRFPSLKAQLGSTDDIRKWAFEQVAKDDTDLSDLTYDRDIKPWIGDRFGVAVVPGAKGKVDPDVLVVIQVSDEGKAKAGLAKLIKPADGSCSVAKGFAVCAETRSILTGAQSAAAQHSLAADAHFKADVASVGKRGIVLAWGDLGQVASLVPNPGDTVGGGFGGGLSGISGLGGLGSTGQVAGRVTATLRFDGGNVELVGKTTGSKAAATAGRPGTGVEALPTKTLVAAGASIDPQAVDLAYSSIRKQLTSVGGEQMLRSLDQQVASMGFHLPQDLKSVLGTKFDVAFGGMGADGMPLVGIRSDADAARAGAVLDNLSRQLARAGAPFTLSHVSAGKGYAAALNHAYAGQLAAGGHLGDQSAFKAAVPDARSAQVVLFANIAALVDDDTMKAFGSGGGVDPDLKALSALGMSATSGSDGSASFSLRVITR